MPVNRSPPLLLGFDEHLQPVDQAEDDEIPVTPEENEASLRQRNLRSRPRLHGQSDGNPEDRLVVADVHQTPLDEDNRGRLPVFERLGSLDLSISTPTVRDSPSTTASTQFDVPVGEESSDDERLSEETVISTQPGAGFGNPSFPASNLEDFRDVSPEIQDVIESIFAMPDIESSGRFARQKQTYVLCCTVYQEEFADLNPSELPSTMMQSLLNQAQDMKNKLLQAQVEIMDATDLEFCPQLRQQGAAARAGFVNFVKLAIKEMKDEELRVSSSGVPSLNSSAASRGSTNRTKLQRVEKYSEPTIGEMQQMIDAMEELILDQPGTQIEFRNLQERVKTTHKELNLVKKSAKELINHAIECDLVDECTRMEDVYRTLEKREMDLERGLQNLKDEYGLVGEHDHKSNDLKYPTFSGDQTEKFDYYSFKEDWDSYVSVKGPSKSEQLRILTKQALTGTARIACKYMTSLEAVFDHLKEHFGNVSDLFSHRVEELRRLGACTGSNEKRRKWAVEIRSQLTYLRDLSTKHGMYEDLYNHAVIAEIQEHLPTEILRKFMEKMRELPGVRASKKTVFEMFLEYLNEVVAVFNYNHTYKLDHGVDPEKYLRTKLEAKKPLPPVKPPTKSKTYTSTTTPGTQVSTGKVKPQPPRNKNEVRVTSSYAAPEMKPCHLCSGKHTHVFYCEEYYKAGIQTDRIRVAMKFQTCFRCLRMDARINFSDRVQWQRSHAVHCQSDWVCTVDVCGDRPRERQYHFTLCKWHEDDNRKKQTEFIKDLDKAQIKPGVSFFFNIPQNYSLNPVMNQIKSGDSSFEVLKDVYEPSIFMLQTVVVNERPLLLFYDSGCLGSAVSDRAAILLNSNCVRPGPTTMNVAGGKTIQLEGGDEQFLLDLVIPNTKATITGLRMPHVTTPFPCWNISKAWDTINLEYKSVLPAGDPLPPAPDQIGGVEVEIMIGIRYQKYFPDLICTLPCGLGIFKSRIKAPRGELTILGGPHRAWRTATDLISFLGATSFFTAEVKALRNEISTLQHVYHPVEQVPDELNLDVVLEDLLEPDHDHVEICSNLHCDKHGDLDDWVIPKDWNIDNSIYGLRQTASKFGEAEQIGGECPYRCVRCRNCAKCRQGESLESASLREEQEQYVIDQSVEFDAEKGCLRAKLAFMTEPGAQLRPNRHVAERILESQLRILSKDDQAKQDVIAAHEKLRSRFYVVALSDLSHEEQELVRSLTDAGYIIPWRPVWKQTSLSTPCRPVFDASSKTPGGESLNNLLAKGINKLAKLFNVLLRFRSKPGAFTCDVKMAYNQIQLDPSHYRYQQYLWKENLDPNMPTVVMIIKTLIYGVRSSGNQLFAGFEKLAEDTILNLPELTAGAIVLRDEGYVDDILHAAITQLMARLAAESLHSVLRRAGLTVKAFTFAGSPPPAEVSADGVHVGTVGLMWAPEEDILRLDIKELYFGKSKRGVLPELVVGDVTEALKRNFTRRNCLGKVAGIFDPAGLATPVTSRLKLDLHDLCLENLGWDDQIPDTYLEKWVRNLDDIQRLREIKFRRTVIPPDAASLDISLLVSSDASKSIAVSCVHARVALVSGGFSSQLYTAKSKIVRYDTIPRAELRAAVMSASLAHSAKFNLTSQYVDSIYVSDSTIVLHWLSHDERPLETSVRNSVIEIRRFTDISQWYHVDGGLNIADLGTRHAEVSEIESDSEWQNGKDWMRLPVSEMPIKTIQEINLSSEEKRLASQVLRPTVMYSELTELIPKVSERYKFSNYLVDPNRYPWDKSLRVLGYVLKFLTLVKKDWRPVWFPPEAPFSSITPSASDDLSASDGLSASDDLSASVDFSATDDPSASVDPSAAVDPSASDVNLHSDANKEPGSIILSHPGCRVALVEYELRRSENYFFYKATLEVIKFSPDREYKDCFITKNGILHYVGRILDSQEIYSPEDTMFDLTPLSFVRPIVDRYSPVGYSVMLHSHEAITHHKSATASLLESRSIAYILRGRDLASEIVKACRPCVRYQCKLLEAEMGKIHQTRLTIAPVFHCSQVDLFGPLIAVCEHQHRSSVKVYGVVFKDPGSCAVAIYVMQNYSTPSFLQAYTRFAARYGHPTELRIDEGSQLMAACKKMELSIVDITNNLSVEHQVGIKYSTCAVANHNAHGMVERSIREIKNLMAKMYKGLKLDILSLETCFAWIAAELNNLPICIGSRVDNLDHVDLITPSRLLLGRNNRRALGGFATVSSPSRLIEQMNRVYEVWWKVWRSEKLVDFIPQPSKWKKTNEQIRIDDVVIFLKSDSEHRFGEPVWKIARVKFVNTSEDGIARTVLLEYRNSNEKTFRTTNRSIRSIVVVHREEDLDVIQSLEQAAISDKDNSS